MTLIHNDDRLDKAVAFCWETQRMLNDARFYGWSYARLKQHVEMRKQLWRRFSSGIRSSAHAIFMEQLNEQLNTPAEQRDKDRPVWLNENLGIGTGRTDVTADDSGTGETPGTRQR